MAKGYSVMVEGREGASTFFVTFEGVAESADALVEKVRARASSEGWSVAGIEEVEATDSAETVLVQTTGRAYFED